MTGGFPEQTKEWARRRGVRYPYCDDATYSLAGPFDIYGLPHAVLIAPSGEVLFSGPSDELTEELIKGALDGALKRPLCDLPDAVGPVRDALVKGDFVAARAALAKLPAETDGLADAKDATEKLFALRLKGVDAALKAGDLLGARTAVDALKGAAAGDAAAEKRLADAEKALAEAPDAAARLAAQKRLRELTVAPASREAAAAALVELKKLAETYAGKPLGDAAARAARFVNRVGQGV